MNGRCWPKADTSELPKDAHNKALQLTANPLRGLTAAELGRYLQFTKTV
jgi:hypothetical protein